MKHTGRPQYVSIPPLSSLINQSSMPRAISLASMETHLTSITATTLFALVNTLASNTKPEACSLSPIWIFDPAALPKVGFRVENLEIRIA
jgi:hypothetical protein